MQKDRVIRDFEDYLKAVNTDDTSMIVLKVHLLTEHYLNRIIELSLKRADRILDKGNMGYYQKVILVSSFDNTPDSVIQCLLQLNSIRNACAHKRDQNISLDDIDKIGRPVGKDYAILRKKYDNNSNTLLSVLSNYICANMTGIIDSIENTLST